MYNEIYKPTPMFHSDTKIKYNILRIFAVKMQILWYL